MLDKAAVVMVRTTHPGNIGAAARAMGNMGLGNLALAEPLCDHKSAEAVARASGFGGMLDRALVHESLAGAISKAQHAYAFTARRRDLAQPCLDVRKASGKMARQLAAGLKVALVFGPEQAGLTNVETDVCDFIVEIPTEAGKSSLNVAAAIQVACHELRMATIGATNPPGRPSLADKGEVQNLMDHFEQVITETCPPGNKGLLDKMLRRLAMLLNRAQPDKADVRMLRGLLSGVAKRRSPEKKKQ